MALKDKLSLYDSNGNLGEGELSMDTITNLLNSK